MSEIISKTLLLANDTLIGDATIRAQIAVSKELGLRMKGEGGQNHGSRSRK